MKRPDSKRCQEALESFRNSWDRLLVEVFPEYTIEEAREFFNEYFKVEPMTLPEELMAYRINGAIRALLDRKKLPPSHLVVVR